MLLPGYLFPENLMDSETTVGAISRHGLTSEFQIVDMGPLSLVWNVIMVQPDMDLAFDTTSLICFVHVRSLDMWASE